jgi:hypothetical protein
MEEYTINMQGLHPASMIAIAVLIFVPQMIAQSFAKLIAALFFKTMPLRTRIMIAGASASVCAASTPLVYMLVKPYFSQALTSFPLPVFFLLLGLAFFIPSALLDLAVLSSFRRLNWKILLVYLIIDALIASKSDWPFNVIVTN